MASGIIGVVKSFALATIKVRASGAVQAAVMGRVMAMPAGFFRRLAPGDIASRLGVADKLAASVLDAAFGLGLTGVLSLLYVFQIVRFAPVLVLPALLVLAAQACVCAVAVFQKTKRLQREMRASSELSGFMLALLGGMQKVRLTGVEMRMLAAWARRYRNVTELRYHLPKLLLWYSVLNAFIGALGTAVLYLVAAAAEVPYADFVAFSSAYGMVCAGFGPLLGIVNVVAQFKPMFDMLEPILGCAPEAEECKPMPAPLSGAIVLDHASFGYPQETPGGEEARGPAVIDDLSLEIAPGEYVGICGTSGCGKSTLMRLMLGFERPWSGQVSFDGQALDAVNLRALRRQIGTVQQNARLMAGSIFQNISVCAPGLTEEQAWEAAEAACLADDIRAMPMKMNTMVSEGGRRPVGRAAPAPAHRARPGGEAADRLHGRGDERPGQRGPGAGGTLARRAEVHAGGHRPPPVHHPQLRPHRGARRRPHRGGRHLRGACRAGRALRRAGAQAAPRRAVAPGRRPVPSAVLVFCNVRLFVFGFRFVPGSPSDQRAP